MSLDYIKLKILLIDTSLTVPLQCSDSGSLENAKGIRPAKTCFSQPYFGGLWRPDLSNIRRKIGLLNKVDASMWVKKIECY